MSGDGSVLTGYCFDKAHPFNPIGQRQVGMLWDASGARDIITELRQANVDMHAITNINPERVWVDNAIHVQGSCNSALGSRGESVIDNADPIVTYGSYGCIAQLPLR